MYFSDKVHFGQGACRTCNIICRPEEVNNEVCIQYDREPVNPERPQKRFHCWVMIGWNYKSLLVFYDIPGNTNGKMTMAKYVQILDEYVKPLLIEGCDFILEEDGDSGHEVANNNNIVKRWKQQHGLKSYFNAAQSPDLAVIENCWQPTKAYIDREDHLEDQILMERIQWSWDQLPQAFINKQVRSMHERMEAVIANGGKRTAY